jgi:5'-methylthioadenosine phosphorylase
MADPVCASLAKHLADSGRAVGATVHEGGTLLTIDGPAFSTRGESHMYRAWGMDIIGMTAMPEAKLAREAEIHYTTLGWVTDYDCWHQSEKPVTVDAIIAILKSNGELANKLLASALPGIAQLEPVCNCASALAVAVVTDRTVITPERKKELGPLVAKYLL